ncbi:MAG: MFS transporter [Alphaproteobacteria bacterium]|nr:MFS transporter [Alphaproteobacteria bacterium]
MIEKQTSLRSIKKSIPGTIFAIGISSMLINMATSVVFSGSALYLKTVLGVAVSTIGALEALVEAIAYGIRIFSGMISDYFKKRKALMVIGFAMIAISKPLLAFSKTFGTVLASRTIDRIGNGIQASPRDALISDVSPEKSKGTCYGLRQSLAVLGSTLGGLFGIAIMKLTNNNFELMFVLAGIPAVIAVVILLLFVKEKFNKQEVKQKQTKIKYKDLCSLGKRYWILLVIVACFMLARFSEVFITLHACGNFGLNVAYGTVITMIYNLLSVFVAYPMGILSDRVNRLNVLLLGFIILCISHLCLGYASSLNGVILGTAFWGIQRGITDSVLATLVSDYVPKNVRGTAFGLFYLVVSLSTAAASAIAGRIAQAGGEGSAYIFGSKICIIAIILLVIMKRIMNRQSD